MGLIGGKTQFFSYCFYSPY